METPTKSDIERGAPTRRKETGAEAKETDHDSKMPSTGRRKLDENAADIDEDTDGSDDEHLAQEGAFEPRVSDEKERLLRREKRLAMNRASARERRRRKRLLLEKLEHRVLELTKQVQTLQETNDGLQAHVSKLEAELLKSHTIISTLSATPASSSSHTGIDASTLQGLNPQGPLRRRLWLSEKRNVPTPAFGSAAPAVAAGRQGSLNDILSGRQIFLDLEAYQQSRRLLQRGASNSQHLSGGNSVSLASVGALGATTRGEISGAGSMHPLLGRMNYLNALTENTLAPIRQRGNLLEGESKVDVALGFPRVGGLTGISVPEPGGVDVAEEKSHSVGEMLALKRGNPHEVTASNFIKRYRKS